MPLIKRGILWSLKVWSAVVTFLLGLAGATPPAQGGQSGTWQSKGNGTAPTADQRPGGTIVLALFYVVSLFADFFAYVDPAESEAQRSLMAPQAIHWFEPDVSTYTLGQAQHRLRVSKT